MLARAAVGWGLVAAVLAAACGTQTVEDDGYQPPPEEPVPYDASTTAYPGGPYGFDNGSVIADYEFPGFPNPETGPTTELVTIRLSDFYNPTGAGTYAEDGPYAAGAPKPRALLMVVSAVWCGPCQLEAAEVLPEKHAAYAGRGGEFLLVLADGPTPGVPAEKKHLASWTKKYETNFPAVLDANYDLGKIFPAASYPANMIIDTRTMTIVDRIVGAAPEEGSFWDTFEQLLAP